MVAAGIGFGHRSKYDCFEAVAVAGLVWLATRDPVAHRRVSSIDDDKVVALTVAIHPNAENVTAHRG